MDCKKKIYSSLTKFNTRIQTSLAKSSKTKLIAPTEDNFIQFGTECQKIKAVSAKKLPMTKSLNKTKNRKNVKDVNHKVMNQKNTTKNKLKELIQKESYGMNSNLLLNICTKPLIDEMKRTEFCEQKRLNSAREKGKVKICAEVLTQEELNQSIRKYGENPNKTPRAADIFVKKDVQKMREAIKSKVRFQNLESSQGIENEIVKVNLQSYKMNVFRVKRAEDSSVKKINLFTHNPVAKVVGQRAVKPVREQIFDGTKVDKLALHSHAIKNLEDLLGITELTTIQRKTIPKALEGRNILVRSQTGSGKTLAYALPLVEILQAIRPKLTREYGTAAVVVVPTRELAIQTYELFLKLIKPFTWLVPGVLMGGEKRKAEKARLRKGINILVGTPGRLVDHLLHTQSLNLGKVQFLVLDEADRLLEMGYERDVKQIVDVMEEHRLELKQKQQTVVDLQRMLLSATLTSAVQKLAGLTLENPVFINNSEESGFLDGGANYNKTTIEAAVLEDDGTGALSIPHNLKLKFVVVPAKLRLVTLAALLAKEYEKKLKFKVIVFMSTTELINFHHDLLNETLTKKVLDEEDEEVAEDHSGNENIGEEPLLKGLRFFKLHGIMTQTERQGVFKGFRACKCGVLLATDVAGRGIDVAEVDLVIQYSPPHSIPDFVHRAGRTARAGRSGCAILFLVPNEVEFVRMLEAKRIRMTQVNMNHYLEKINDIDDEAHTAQEAASNLQHKFQELVQNDKDMYEKACKAFVSWMKFYSTFTRELKPIFNIKNVHTGHFAKSFALKDAPSSFAQKYFAPRAPLPVNKLTYIERDTRKLKLENKKVIKKCFTTTVKNKVRNSKDNVPSNNLLKNLHTSVALSTSEFDSGLLQVKKRKIQN